MKMCTICRETKPLSEFHKQATRADGYANWCKPCKSEKKRLAYAANPFRARERAAAYRIRHPEKVSEGKKQARIKKLDQYKERSRKRYQENRESMLAYAKAYRVANWPRVLATNAAYKRERLRKDHLYRLEYAVRNRTFVALRDKGYGKKSKTRELVGCEWPELMAHLQSKFTEGMTMDNYGEWHVDHVVPLSSAKTEEELIRLCHYSNLQPLWAADNIRKGARV
jgi:thiol-disulfide isomerase/thioredoxin